jgi:hypothetical protein
MKEIDWYIWKTTSVSFWLMMTKGFAALDLGFLFSARS